MSVTTSTPRHEVTESQVTESQVAESQGSGAPPSISPMVDAAVTRLAAMLNANSITVLRFSLGLVFLVFASFKFVPGLSPAQDLAVATIEQLTFGMVTGASALLMTAVTETVIGLTLLTGRFLRAGLVVLAGALVGIMSPLVLFADQLYGNGPTLTAQYVFKDIVLAAAALVVGAHALGGRLRPQDD